MEEANGSTADPPHRRAAAGTDLKLLNASIRVFKWPFMPSLQSFQLQFQCNSDMLQHC